MSIDIFDFFLFNLTLNDGQQMNQKFRRSLDEYFPSVATWKFWIEEKKNITYLLKLFFGK